MSTVMDVPVVYGSNLNAKITIPDTLQITTDNTPPAGYRMIRVLNSKDGDKRIVWNADRLVEIQDAKKMFNELLASGLSAFAVGSQGEKTNQEMKEFDPTAEEIIFCPIHLARGG